MTKALSIPVTFTPIFQDQDILKIRKVTLITTPQEGGQLLPKEEMKEMFLPDFLREYNKYQRMVKSVKHVQKHIQQSSEN